ncbi:hypothetical protein I6G82_02815 [Lysinibacillus macroides]|uniref:Uncharacterized protein n=1 Tax=Lysinibacillus macroides TaxID=33935 RepID=A0A0N0UWF3_9BACI|nr:hypothetical protein [Lysinibacillus macroides]KOY81261.1 hypothetical protein ADM90_19170 [Lysinibacillus macroides]QPR68580.1 hypothetical protein I6G82_02815 [Lysinibacillus macroides]
MNESSKYSGFTFGNNNGNFNLENNGTLNQGVAKTDEDIATALKQINEEIKKLSEDKREIAEPHFDLLQTHLKSGDKEKAKKPLEKLNTLLGSVGSILTIASFLGFGLPLK